MEYFPVILTVAAIHFLALMSPGPDFILIVQNSLLRSRRAGIYTALGLAGGIVVHMAYSLLGIGFIISRSILLFSIIKYLGAGYLIYIGYKSLRAKKESFGVKDAAQAPITFFEAWRTGFITNATNPKATLFFLSVFTLVINPHTPLYIELIMGAEMVAATFLWFSVVAIVFSHRVFQGRVQGIQYYAEKVLGAVLIALGIKLATASR